MHIQESVIPTGSIFRLGRDIDVDFIAQPSSMTSTRFKVTAERWVSCSASRANSFLGLSRIIWAIDATSTKDL